MNPDQAVFRRYSQLEFPFRLVFVNSVQGTALIALALWMGAGAVEVSIIASFPFLGNLFAVFGPYFLQRFGTKKRLTIGAFSISAAFYAVMPILVFLGDVEPGRLPLLRIALIATVAFGEILRALANVSYLAWIADVFPPDTRARFFSARFSVMAIANMLSGLAVGQYLNLWGLGREIDPKGFYTLIPLAMVSMIVGISLIGRIPGGDLRELPTAARGLRGHLAPFKDPNYRGFLAARALQAVAFMLVGPFLTVFLIVDLGLSYSTVFLLMVISQGFAVIGFRYWGRMLARTGPRRIYIAAAVVFSFHTFIYAWAGVLGIWLLAPLHIVTGFFEGGFLLAVQVLTMNLAPEHRQIAYVGTANGLTGLLLGITSIAGGFLVGPLAAIPLIRELSPIESGIPALFILSGVLRLLILPSLWWTRNQPVRTQEAAD